MKRILVMVLGLVGALTVIAQEVKLGKVEVIDLGKDVKLEMVLIPAGKFKMGWPATEKERSNNETQREVTLTKPFYMGKYEVTQEQWEAIMGNNPNDNKGPKLPITDVSWNDCQNFIKKLNAKTNGGYRLPTEAEWEYACRAGTTTAYSFGDKVTPEDVNNDDSKKYKPLKVGTYKPNSFGLYDMHGNVCEWCKDWYGDYPAGAVTDPKGPLKGENHVVRGGAFSVSTMVVSVEGKEDEFYQDIRFSPAKSSTRAGWTSPAPNVIGFRLVKTK